MVYNLLEKAIEQKNSFMTKEMIELQIEFFYEAERITESERAILLDKLNPPVEEIIEETPEELPSE